MNRKIKRPKIFHRMNKITHENWANAYHPNYTQSTMSVYQKANQRVVDEWGAEYRAMFPRSS